MSGVPSAFGQDKPHHGDVTLTYDWVHTNAQPGECGCFGLNGGGVSASFRMLPRMAAVLDVSGGYQGSEPSTGNTLTLVSYMAGGRYNFGPSHRTSRGFEPFGQVLLGAAHAGGGVAGVGDGNTAFALRAGGGLDLALRRSFALRLVQADYYLTEFSNTTNNRQNNFMLGAGLVFRY